MKSVLILQVITISWTYFKQLMKKWVFTLWKFAKNLALLYCVNLILIINKSRQWEIPIFCFSVLSPILHFLWFHNFLARSTWWCKINISLYNLKMCCKVFFKSKSQVLVWPVTSFILSWYKNFHPSMALQPLPGLGLTHKMPPFISICSSSPPSSYPQQLWYTRLNHIRPSSSWSSHWSCGMEVSV